MIFRLRNARALPRVIESSYRELKPRSIWDVFSRLLKSRPGSYPLTIRLRLGEELVLQSRGELGIFLSIWLRNDYGRLPIGCAVMDVGANTGLFTLYSLTHGAKSVVAIEPLPSNVQILTARLRDWGLESKAKVVPAALSSTPGKGNLVVKSFDTGHLQVEPSTSVETVTVDCWTLSEATAQLDAPYASIVLKMDIEGGEHAVLDGINDAAWDAVTSVRMEYHEIGSRGLASVQSALHQGGFSVSHVQSLSQDLGLLWADKAQDEFEGGIRR